MAMNFLEFEQPIAELEAKIEELKFLGADSSVNITEEVKRLQSKSRALTNSIFSNLSPWQITQLARHPQRPYTLDYVSMIFTEWHELHGDRMYSDDLAIVGGLARLEGIPVMLIGHQKGRDTKERVRRNYGMPKPEGYRKALRLMRMAERFRMPIITLIDTPGAYPGIGSEERGQSEAIARNLFEMSHLAAPVLSIVIGEGGSGGALAIGVCDRLVMLQFSTYSVISPESCASILWKSTDKKEISADAMGGTADRLKKLGLVDEVLKEPNGAAHRDPQAMAEVLKQSMIKHLNELRNQPITTLLDTRQARLRGFGVFRELEPAMTFGAAPLCALLEELLPDGVTGLVVGLSGGGDSACLLAALAQAGALPRRAPPQRAPPRRAPTAPRIEIRAVHIDHGLQASAPEFRAASAALCARLSIPLTVITIAVDAAGASIEAAAREARYRALARELAPGECLLTAHHANDQAETLLLQLLRGAGLPGLAAMPGCRRLGRGWHVRPLLAVAQRELLAFGAAHGVHGTADPMNHDTRFDRAFVRAHLWPLIEARWPGAASALGRTAQHLAQAQALLEQSAGRRLRRLRDGDALSVTGLRALSTSEQINTLRHWLSSAAVEPPPAARLAEALRQMLDAQPDHLPAIAWGAHALRRYRDRLFLTPALVPALGAPCEWSSRLEARVELGPGLGRLRWASQPGGLDAARLPRTLSVRRRSGGEVLKAAPRARTQSVQHLCQSRGVLPWMRDALPMVYAHDTLIAVGDLWHDARWCVAAGAAGLRCVWEGAPTLG